MKAPIVIQPILSKEEGALLAEALRVGRRARPLTQDALVEYGRWILAHLFGEDPRAAVEQRESPRVWRALLGACGPKLNVSERLLRAAVSIAAYHKTIDDNAWRLLEPGRRPVASSPAGARAPMPVGGHATKVLAGALGEAIGGSATVERVFAKVAKFNYQVTTSTFDHSVDRAVTEATAADRVRLRHELEQLATWATRSRERFR